MKIKTLLQHFPDLQVRGSKEVEILGMTANSKVVAPGDLFVAKRGKNYDGSQFIADVVLAGAAAILTDIADPFVNCVQLIHPEIAKIEAQLAARFYHYPSKRLPVIGVTGTNGKTTVSYLLHHLFEKRKISCGLIGTVDWIIGKHKRQAGYTTPDVITTQKLLHEMIQENCKRAVMEVSSHALDQGRVNEVDFSIGVFTNFSHDHLDYHETMEAYRNAKAKLFENLSEKAFAIFNSDFEKFQTKANIFTYGLENHADLMATNLQLDADKTSFHIVFEDRQMKGTFPLVGRFNVYNLLAAIAVGYCSGISVEDCIKTLKSFRGVPGRLEKVADGVFVDFAHTEDGLQNVLATLRLLTKGKLIVVFGCGGNRDALKRPKMGKVACELADLVIVTSDNPRRESPTVIIDDILQGCDSKAIRIEDRKEAIGLAIESKKDADIVLIAGKGHEKQQIFSHQIIPFDDVEIARQFCEVMCAK